MRYAVFFILILVLASCRAPAQPAPTATPDATATAELAKAAEVVDQFRRAGPQTFQDILALEESAGVEFMDAVCRVSKRKYVPDLYPIALTVDTNEFFAIRNYCFGTRWDSFTCIGCSKAEKIARVRRVALANPEMERDEVQIWNDRLRPIAFYAAS